MTTVPRHVLLETFKTLCVAALVMLAGLLMLGGAQQAVRHGLPPRIVAQVLPYLAPEMLRFALPGCLLFAVCRVFGRMSAGNEILALKAAGIAPVRLVWPVLALAFLLSLLTYQLYDTCAMWARPGLKRVLLRATDDIIYSYLTANKSFANRQFSIAVKRVDGGELIQPVIQLFERDGTSQSLTLSAERAQITCSDVRDTLRLTCYRGWVDVGDQANLTFNGLWTSEIELPSSGRDELTLASPAALRVAELEPQIAHERRWLQTIGRRPVATTRLAPPSESEWQWHEERLYRLQAETQRRLSNGFACVCFTLVGIPVAMWRKSADSIGVFFLCFGPILLIYYPLLVIGENLARDGLCPRLAVWLADGVLLALGLPLMRWQTRR